MSPREYRFNLRWKEELVCECVEQPGDVAVGKLVLEATMGALTVYFPTESVWPSRAPAWALHERNEILCALRSWCEASKIPLVVDDSASVGAEPSS